MKVFFNKLTSALISLNRVSLAILFLALVACSDGSDNNDMANSITGLVTDSSSSPGQLIVGARVTLIQGDGEATAITTTTDSQGHFTLVLPDEPDVDLEFLAVVVSASNFRQREVNVSIDENNIILLSSKDIFDYTRPVQLSDGINVEDLNQSTLNASRIKLLLNRTLLQPDSVAADFSGGYKELHSLLIYKDGALVVEEYYSGNNDVIDFEGGIIRKPGNPAQVQWSRKDKHYIASVNKSLTSSIAGMVFGDFDVPVDDPISKYLPLKNQFFADANKASLSIHDMMTMQLGFVWNEWSSNDLASLWASTDFTDFLLSRSNNGPKSAWVYNSASPNMLLRALENIVQGPIRDWADINFYSKLGITDYDWQSQPDGLPEGAARMHMRPRDMLKVGITYLNNGVWNDEQIIPSAWVEEVSRTQVASFAGDYSYYFWIRELDGIVYLSADGDGGQYINIFPEQNMVIVMTQGNYGEFPLYVNQANDMMTNFIFPALPASL